MKARDLDRFCGMVYSKSAFDCADFVVYVQRELFGRNVTMPSRRPRGAQGQAALGALSAQYVDARQGAAQDGDLVLMYDMGKRARGHVGVYFRIGGCEWVLHCTDKLGGSVVTARSDLQNMGLIIEGIYGWPTDRNPTCGNP